SRYQRRTFGFSSASFSSALMMPSSVSSALVPPMKVFAVTSSRKELETSAKRPSLSALSLAHMSAQEGGAVLKPTVLEPRGMDEEREPVAASLPSGYLLTKRSMRFFEFGIFAMSSGAQRLVDWPFSIATCDIIETSAGAAPALAACSSCTSQASPVGSATD